MWHAARKHEKHLAALSADSKARAERRAKYYQSRLADPSQLLRVTGVAVKTYPDAQLHFYHENADNLLKWSGDGETRIDRFDARGLLDFLSTNNVQQNTTEEEEELEKELNFERYRDVVDALRMDREEHAVLEYIDASWNDLLKKPDAPSRQSTSKEFAFDYGASEADVPPAEEEDSYLREHDLQSNLERLSESDVKTITTLGEEYGVDDFVEMLRSEKSQMEQHAADEEAGLKLKRKRRLRKRGLGGSSSSEDIPSNEKRSSRRSSPTYEPYKGGLRIKADAGPPVAHKFEDKVEYITELEIDSSAFSSTEDQFERMRSPSPEKSRPYPAKGSM
ncbi:hypothetical protein HDV00_009261 [Rhizophlyctis rosea]|nr:hypothetical protein HDV00_009261 [Rhizophlyctis rosea]